MGSSEGEVAFVPGVVRGQGRSHAIGYLECGAAKYVTGVTVPVGAGFCNKS